MSKYQFLRDAEMNMKSANYGPKRGIVQDTRHLWSLIAVNHVEDAESVQLLKKNRKF